MTAAIFSFYRRRSHEAPLAPKMPWQNQDLAELYRVRDRLAASGLAVEVEGGVSDEGDPWFVYQQVGTDTVVVHICRIDTEIHVINCVTGNAYKGSSFREVSDRMLEDAPLALGADIRRSSNVVLHPSAFLTAFVAAAIMLVDLVENGRAEAAEFNHDGDMPALAPGHHGDGAPAEAGAMSGGERHQTQPDNGGEDGGMGQRRIQLLKEMAGSLSNGSGSGTHGGVLSEVPMASLSAGLFAAELMRAFVQDNDAWHMRDHAGNATLGIEGFLSDLGFAAESGRPVDTAISAAPSGEDSSLLVDAKGLGKGDLAQTGGADASARVHVADNHADIQGPIHRTHFNDVNARGGEHAAPQDMAAANAPAAATEASSSTAAPASQAPSRSEAAAAPADQAQAQSVQSLQSAQPARGVGSTSASTTTTDAGPSVTARSAGDSAPISEKTAASATDLGKTLAGTAHDIDWMIGQITRSRLTSHDNDGAGTKTIGTTVTGSSGDASHSDRSDAPAIKLVDATAGKESDDRGDKAGSLVLSGGAGKMESDRQDEAGPGHDPSHPAGGADEVRTPVEWTAPDALMAGRFDAVRVEAGADLTIRGFVFGEDLVSFANDAAAASYTKHVWQDGTDLVLGDASSGTVRLVGVFADPGLVHHEGAGAIAA